MIPVYLLTNDKHMWLLRGFAYLWNEFYGSEQYVYVYGYNAPGFELPGNFRFHSLGPDNAPVERWSDGLIEMLNRCPFRWLVLMLEDFWLTGPTDPRAVHRLWNHLMKGKEDILRVDLSGNRASYKQSQANGRVDDYEIVETPAYTPYQMSFQAAIWHKANLLNVLRRGETPWQAEVDGSKRVGDLRVLGTRPAVLRYQPVYRAGRGTLDVSKVPAEHKKYIEGQGWLM